MSAFLKRSRVTKAFADAALVSSFSEAEARLDAATPCVVLGADQATTPAGQAAALTAIATAYKCFGHVWFECDRGESPLIFPFPIGSTIGEAARNLGAQIGRPHTSTHTVQIGASPRQNSWTVFCWWDRWLSGTRVDTAETPRDSRLALSGVFAGALAVRQVFANVRLGSSARPKDITISLWTPWAPLELDAIGPDQFTVPDALWLIGLGHLGQGYIWNLLTLPYTQKRRAVLQDDQRIALENEVTSLLVLPDAKPGKHKARLASRWLEAAGWETALIERRHRGDIAPGPDDPPILLCGLDSLPARKLLVTCGFDFVVDGGIGHGPSDFEGLQVRVIPKGADPDALWKTSTRPQDQKLDRAIARDRILAGSVYQALDRTIGACGTFNIADASVAVPFVGAATGAVAIAQIIRLASMTSGGALIQMELGAPEYVLDGGLSPRPNAFLGGECIRL